MTYIPLTNRTLLAISGDDALPFLQGLISNDINKVNSTNAIYALMLTPQGKFLYDFFIYEYDGRILLDCNAAKIEEIKKKLTMYKLRSKVVIEDISAEYNVVALISPSAAEETIYPDPRSNAMPARAIIKKLETSKGNLQDYELLRIKLCIPSDIDMEDSFPLEYAMDTHNAIDYQKGCYVGQEVTARTHYRGVVRKKPYVVMAEPDIDLSKYKGHEITKGPHKVGIMRSSAGNIGIALLRTEDLEKANDDIVVGDVRLGIIIP